MDVGTIQETLLQVIHDQSGRGSGLQSRTVLRMVSDHLKISSNLQAQQALLTCFHTLIRTGHIAWGYDILNADPPFFHITDQGRRVLAQFSRDPINPDGYMAHLHSIGHIEPITLSYITEALKTYRSDCHKATAVMVGCASESIVLQLRDTLEAKMKAKSEPVPAKLTDWKIKTILSGIDEVLRPRKADLKPLWESFESYWPAFTQQIRTVRNDAGHPTDVDPVPQHVVHASLLIFPELVRLACELEKWIVNYY